MTIHQRAEQLVRESRGQLNISDAYRELARRAQVVKAAKKRRLCTMPHDPTAYKGVERPYRMPYIDPDN